MHTFWRIQTLGQLCLSSADHAYSRFQTQRTASLLAYLSLHTNRDHSRNDIGEVIWPGADLDQSRNRLRQSLATLRSMLEPPGVESGTILMSTRTHVRLNPEAFWVDAVEFERLVRLSGRAEFTRRIELLEQAVGIYTGELLPGIYDDWALLDRERLSGLASNALTFLGSHYRDQGDGARGLDSARRAAAISPFDEGVQADFLEHCISQGRIEEGRVSASTFIDRITSEFGEEPSREFLAKFARLASTEFRAPRPHGPTEPPAAEVGSQDKPLPPKAAVPSTLPLQYTRFVGRSNELEQLLHLLRNREKEMAPLITITGAGGIGKSRLALELAMKAEESVCHVPLGAVETPDLITSVIAGRLGVSPEARDELISPIADQLVVSAKLLVLDGLEHLLPEAAQVVRRLRQSATGVAIVATSRQRIGLDDEYELALKPLATPQPGSTPEEIADADGVRLFIDRAQRARTGFHLNPRNAGAIEAICKQLDGLPLAIELAAAWIGVLSPEGVLAQLNSMSGDILTARSERGEMRRSIRGSLEWSLNLAPQDLCAALCALSVFKGSFSEGAAASVLASGNEIATLGELCERSLLIAEEGSDEFRVRMLAPLRECASSLITAQERQEYQRRHAHYFCRRAMELEIEMQGPRQAQILAWFEQEIENLRSALVWSLEMEPDVAQNLAGACWRFWHDRSLLREGLKWCEASLQLSASKTSPQVRGRAANGAGILAMTLGEYPLARKRLTESLHLRELDGDPGPLAAAHNNLGNLGLKERLWEDSIQCYERALQLWNQVGNHLWIGQAHGNLGLAYAGLGNSEAAETQYRTALQILTEVDSRNGLGNVLCNLCHLSHKNHRYDEAITYGQSGLRYYSEIGATLAAASIWVTLGETHFALGDHVEAMENLSQALDAFVRAEDTVHCVETLCAALGPLGALEDYESLGLSRGAIEGYKAVHPDFGLLEGNEFDIPEHPAKRSAFRKAKAVGLRSEPLHIAEAVAAKYR